MTSQTKLRILYLIQFECHMNTGIFASVHFTLKFNSKIKLIGRFQYDDLLLIR